MTTVGWKRSVAAVLPAVSIDEVKDHCEISHDNDDFKFERWVKAATSWLEQYTGRSLLTQTHIMTLSQWATPIQLRFGAPLQTVSTVQYYDENNALQTWASSNYLVETTEEPGLIEILPTATIPSTFLRNDAIKITYVAGYTAASLVPPELAQAIHMLVAHWHSQRESVLVGMVSKDIEYSVQALCAPHRVFWSWPC